ncbi:uncharacterized protein LOC131958238 [Physella acuta]|uniref:uncharacterized protein LOC131958238 n=1 Tax=Physella acuta TaxID=109671 RepID=UPI0027DEA9A2|nr:uncharacterized protein LOC131958238 [Physella acuta]
MDVSKISKVDQVQGYDNDVHGKINKNQKDVSNSKQNKCENISDGDSDESLLDLSDSGVGDKVLLNLSGVTTAEPRSINNAGNIPTASLSTSAAVREEEHLFNITSISKPKLSLQSENWTKSSNVVGSTGCDSDGAESQTSQAEAYLKDIIAGSSQFSTAVPGQLSPAAPGQLSPAASGQSSSTVPGQSSSAAPSQFSPAASGQFSPAASGQFSPRRLNPFDFPSSYVAQQPQDDRSRDFDQLSFGDPTFISSYFQTPGAVTASPLTGAPPRQTNAPHQNPAALLAPAVPDTKGPSSSSPASVPRAPLYGGEKNLSPPGPGEIPGCSAESQRNSLIIPVVHRDFILEDYTSAHKPAGEARSADAVPPTTADTQVYTNRHGLPSMTERTSGLRLVDTRNSAIVDLSRTRISTDGYPSANADARREEDDEEENEEEDSPLLDNMNSRRAAGRSSVPRRAAVGPFVNFAGPDRGLTSSETASPSMTKSYTERDCLTASGPDSASNGSVVGRHGVKPQAASTLWLRNSYGEYSPLAEAGASDRALTWRHCHKKRPALTDKLALRQLVSVVVLCVLFMTGEAIGGALSNSLALFTDVLHLGSDLVSFIISLIAMWLSNKPATKRMSFGYHRAEVMGALLSVFLIWLVSGVLCYIAVERIMQGHYMDVKPDEMLITASLGVLFNFIMGFVLHSEVCCGKAHSHNKFGHGHSHGGGHGHGHSHSPYPKELLDVPSSAPVEEEAPSNSGRYQRLPPDSEFDASGQAMRDVSSQELGNCCCWFCGRRCQLTRVIVDVCCDGRGCVRDVTSQELETSRDVSDEEALHKHKNINVRAAFIHVVGDIIQSLGVLVAALIIKFTHDDKFRLADPICTFLFSVLVLITTFTVLRDALLVVMEGVPRDLSYESLKRELAAIDGVVAVHSLHIWALTLDRNSLSVHLAVENPNLHSQVLAAATKLVQDNHHFIHSTIQVELYDEVTTRDCGECQALV